MRRWNAAGRRLGAGRLAAWIVGLVLGAPALAGAQGAGQETTESPAAVGERSPEGGAQEGVTPGKDAPQPKITPPKLVAFEDAVYPPEAFAAGIEAAVKLAIAIDEAGTVTEVQVLEPAGQGFDAAAVEAARKFRFEPARADEQPIPVAIRFTYRFTIQQEQRKRPVQTEITLKGQVRQRGDRKPLAEMGVRIRDSEHETQTDEDGRFELALPPGKYTLEVIHPRFEPYETEEEIRAGEVVEGTYYVEKQSKSRYRSVVTSRRAKKTVTRTQLEDVELVQVPGTFGEPFRVVQSLPGVARSPFGTTFLIVRGAAPEDSGFFLDGHPMPDLYHFLAGPALVNAELIDTIEFYPGNYPVSYGNKQAGIVTASTRAAKKLERTEGSLSVDLLDAEGLVRIPVGEDTEIAVAARRSHFDLFLPLVTDEGVRPKYWDYQVVGSTRLGRWSSQLMVFGGSDVLTYEQEPDSKDDPGNGMQIGMDRQFHQLQGKLVRPVGKGGKLTLSPMLGAWWMEVSFDDYSLSDSAVEGGLRAELRLPLLGESLTLVTGTKLNFGQETFDFQFAGAPSATDFPHPWRTMADEVRPATDLTESLFYHNHGAWASLEWSIGPLTLIPGLRADYFKAMTYTDTTVDPRLVARVKVLDMLTLKGGVGIFTQRPNGQALHEEYGAPDNLHNPWAIQQTAGFELNPLDFLDIDASVYYNSYRDLIVPGRIYNSGGQVEQEALFSNDGEGRSYGMELLVRHRPNGPFFGWIAYTLARSERRRSGEDWDLYDLDQTHILTAVGSYDIGAGWTAGLRFQLVSGLPKTPITGSVFDSDVQAYMPVQGATNSDRESAYHRLDLRVDKLFTFDTWKLTAYLDLQNVYNYRSTEFTVYNYDYSKSKSIPGLPILPSLGVKGEF